MPVIERRQTPRRSTRIAGLVAAVIAVPLAVAPAATGATRAAFYYPWFPETWGSGTNYHPTLGMYDSGSPSVIQRHLRAMEYGGIGVGIASWWGQGKKTDARVPALLSATSAMGSAFKWTLYHEQEGYGDPSPSALASDLAYIKTRYASHPSYLEIDGRPVIFVYGGESCAGAERWRQANAGIGFHVVLKVFHGYRSCAGLVDGWHQYSPAVATDSQDSYSFSISPGFAKRGQNERLRRDIGRWQQNVREMAASGAFWQLVTTFNEWGEGTAVESAQEWASPSGYGGYLDVLHAYGGAVNPPSSRGEGPRLRGLSLAPRAFRAARSGAALAARVGTRVRYKLTAPATVRFTVRRALAGRLVSRRCKRPGRRHRRRPRCTRFRRVKGAFERQGNAGPNALRFRGRLAGRALRRGRYRLTAVASDVAGHRSRARHAAFRITR
jgi:hypothetical protein